MTETEKSIY
ncbi:hypothetical protein RDI58_012384 [Solanum bulbocastanum]|uniref:Uncharacterized protein n=1 Tax=Solanum bulbocastanum TaxID=147425 RepID=A0AAN8TRK5_SOLBU